MDRLFEGARSIDLDIGLDRAGVIKAVQDTLDRNGMTDGAHVRLDGDARPQEDAATRTRAS